MSMMLRLHPALVNKRVTRILKLIMTPNLTLKQTAMMRTMRMLLNTRMRVIQTHVPARILTTKPTLSHPVLLRMMS